MVEGTVLHIFESGPVKSADGNTTWEFTEKALAKEGIIFILDGLCGLQRLLLISTSEVDNAMHYSSKYAPP